MKKWDDFFLEEKKKAYYQELMRFVEQAYEETVVYPLRKDLFSCFELCPLEKLKVVILGQDPYIHENQAHGLCFSVGRGEKIPPSLRNIYRELEEDLGIQPPDHGCLTQWAKQGILMMNAVLTVEAGKSASHRGKGWETFTDDAIRFVSDHASPSVFVLWGKWAQKKLPLIDQQRHRVIQGAHPSPLSAHHGFFHTHPFSRINEDLEELGREPVDWRLSR